MSNRDRDEIDDDEDEDGIEQVSDMFIVLGENPITVLPRNIVALEIADDTVSCISPYGLKIATQLSLLTLSKLPHEIELPAQLLNGLPKDFLPKEPAVKLVLSSRTHRGGEEDGSDEMFCGLAFRAADGKSFSDIYRIPDPLIPNPMWNEIYRFAREVKLLDAETAGPNLDKRPNPNARKGAWRTYFLPTALN